MPVCRKNRAHRSASIIYYTCPFIQWHLPRMHPYHLVCSDGLSPTVSVLLLHLGLFCGFLLASPFVRVTAWTGTATNDGRCRWSCCMLWEMQWETWLAATWLSCGGIGLFLAYASPLKKRSYACPYPMIPMPMHVSIWIWTSCPPSLESLAQCFDLKANSQPAHDPTSVKIVTIRPFLSNTEDPGFVFNGPGQLYIEDSP